MKAAISIVMAFACMISFAIAPVGGTAAAEVGAGSPMDAIVSPLAKRGEIVGLAAAVLARKNAAEFFTYGETVRGSGRRPSAATLFQIGSITKTFTGLLLAILAGRKLVRFEDPVQKFVPAGTRVPTYNGREISLLDLATHRSGLPRNPPMTRQQMRLSSGEMYGLLRQVRLTREPGSRYEYSNWGYGLLADALVRAAKAGDYQKLLAREILAPLGMPNTTTQPNLAALADIATGYRRDGHPAPLQMTTWPALDGAGALYSNANDMAKYLSFLFGSTETTLNSALAVVLQRRPTGVPSPEFNGLGWEISTDQKSNLTLIAKTGGTLGFQSYIGFNREHGTGVVVLGNSLATRSALIGRQMLARLS